MEEVAGDISNFSVVDVTSTALLVETTGISVDERSVSSFGLLQLTKRVIREKNAVIFINE
tara:strand:+ start:1085 stop:1264 length:180 start_codon:yes stop_codon:yes gene_type:complete